MLFFLLRGRRYETASTVLTHRKPFEDWGEAFGDDAMAGALIDQLMQCIGPDSGPGVRCAARTPCPASGCDAGLPEVC
jgi:hypothetical protein